MTKGVFLIVILSLIFLAGCQNYFNDGVRGVDVGVTSTTLLINVNEQEVKLLQKMDADGSGKIDNEDFFLFSSYFGTKKDGEANEAGFFYNESFDYDNYGGGDGDIDNDDFFLLSQYFGKSVQLLQTVKEKICNLDEDCPLRVGDVVVVESLRITLVAVESGGVITLDVNGVIEKIPLREVKQFQNFDVKYMRSRFDGNNPKDSTAEIRVSKSIMQQTPKVQEQKKKEYFLNVKKSLVLAKGTLGLEQNVTITLVAVYADGRIEIAVDGSKVGILIENGETFVLANRLRITNDAQFFSAENPATSAASLVFSRGVTEEPYVLQFRIESGFSQRLQESGIVSPLSPDKALRLSGDSQKLLQLSRKGMVYIPDFVLSYTNTIWFAPFNETHLGVYYVNESGVFKLVGWIGAVGHDVYNVRVITESNANYWAEVGWNYQGLGNLSRIVIEVRDMYDFHNWEQIKTSWNIDVRGNVFALGATESLEEAEEITYVSVSEDVTGMLNIGDLGNHYLAPRGVIVYNPAAGGASNKVKLSLPKQMLWKQKSQLKNTCEDSDFTLEAGGINVYMAGKVEGYDKEGNAYEHKDECILPVPSVVPENVPAVPSTTTIPGPQFPHKPSSLIREWYCVGPEGNEYPSSTEQKCIEGCVEGKCLLEGDVNKDGCVNHLDAFALQPLLKEYPLVAFEKGRSISKNYNKGDCKETLQLDGDLNNDGCVNFFDYGILEEIVQPGVTPVYKKDRSHLIKPGYDLNNDGEVDEFDYFVLRILPESGRVECRVVPTKLQLSLQTEKKEYKVGEEVRLTGLGAFSRKSSGAEGNTREGIPPVLVPSAPPQRVAVSVDDDPRMGEEDAPVTMIEFSDFQCPFCGKFSQGTLPLLKKEYIDTGKVKFVYRDFPLTELYPYAGKAAEAAECADEQGKFWEYHDKLFENQQTLDIASLKKHAEDLELDFGKFDDCLDSGKYQEEVQHDVSDGKAANVEGVPSFFINGIPLVGAQPLEVFQEIIDKELGNKEYPTGDGIAPPGFPGEEAPEESNPEEELQPSGYLIEFTEEPLLVKKQQLEEQLQRDKTRAAKMAVWNPLRLFLLSEEDVQEGLQDHRVELEEEHAQFASMLQNRLAKPAGNKQIVLGEYFNVFNGVALDISVDELVPLQDSGLVQAIYPNMPYWLMIEDSRNAAHVPEYVEAPDASGNLIPFNVDGSGVVIAIIDTGVDYTHPDLGGCGEEQFLTGRCDKVIGGYDFASNDADPIDEMGHGTHVAGIAAGTGAASAGRYRGVAPGAQILAYKIFTPGVSLAGGSLEKAFEHLLLSSFDAAMDPNSDGDFSDRADIISMSLGGFETLPVQKALESITREGVVVVVSAGNSGETGYFSTAASPGMLENVLTVGSSTQVAGSEESGGPDEIAFYSSIGPSYYGTLKPDVVAPGGDGCDGCDPCPYAYGVVSAFSPHVREREDLSFFGRKERDALCTLENPYYIRVSGTSMAAPFISGVVALVKQRHPEWSVEDVKFTLRGTAQDIGYDVYHQGLGRVDVSKALQVAEPYPIAKFAPLDRIFLHEQEIAIDGGAYGKHFLEYRLSAAYGRDGEFTEFYSSAQPVYHGILGTLNLEGVENQQVTIRLDVFDEVIVKDEQPFIPEIHTEKRVSRDYLTFFVGNSQWKPGWPRRLGRDLLYKKYAPLAEDIDEDGNPELIVSSSSMPVSRLYVFDAAGRDVPGWPQQLPRTFDGNTPAIGDVDGDGKKDIVYLTNNPVLRFDSYPHFLYVWGVNGRQVDDAFPVEYPDGFSLAYPVLVDIDGDGEQEIFAAGKEQIRLYRGDGETVRGDWEKLQGDKWQLPAIGDLDGDGKPEIVMYEHSTHKLYAFDSSGKIMPGFPVEVGTGDYLRGSTLALGDLDRDGFLDIVLAHGCGLYAFNRFGEALEGGWGEILNRCGYSNLILEDLDGNGYLEIVFSELSSGILIFNNRGFLMPGYPVFIGSRGIVPLDVDGDGVKEILGASADSFVILKIDGSVQYFTPPFSFSDTILEDAGGFSLRTTEDGVAVVDVDGDGHREIVAVYPFDAGFLFSTSASTLGGYAFVFEPEIAVGEPSWKGPFGNVQNTAAYTLPLKEDPAEYSALENPDTSRESFFVEFKLQKFSEGSWIEVMAFLYAHHTLEPGGFVLLEEFIIKKPLTLHEPGKYRFYLHLKNKEGYELLNLKHGLLERSFEFTVKE